MNQLSDKHRKLFSVLGIIMILLGIVLTTLSLSGYSRAPFFMGLMPLLMGAACFLIASRSKE